MQALVGSFTLAGIEAIPVEVQVFADNGYPITTIVGLPGKAVRESLDRISAAIQSAGLRHPDKRITVNLAPAEIPKDGSGLDLAIALGILASLEVVPSASLRGLSITGELSLSGEVRPVRGALAMAQGTVLHGRRALLLPEENLAEASEIENVKAIPVRSLAETLELLRNGGVEDAEASNRRLPLGRPESGREGGPDLAEIRGQVGAKRALEIAAAGGHNLLLSGPPGAGKTLLAQRLAGILPPLDREESLEVTLIHSAAGLLRPGVGRMRERPFRAPHHTVTGPGLVGGGAIPRPGEISLAHGGVLFLDEMPEFRSPVLNLLRQPLEEGSVRIVRAGRTLRFPSRFMLVGAMNPCMCGFLGHPRRPCRCTPFQLRAYRNRLSGPLLDRIDMHVEVPAVAARELTRGLRRRRGEAADAAADRSRSRGGGAGRVRSTGASEAGAARGCGDPAAPEERAARGELAISGEPGPESSASVRDRVLAARRRQAERFAGDSVGGRSASSEFPRPGAAKNEGRAPGASIHCNAQMGIREVEEFCRLDAATRALVHQAMEARSMSARAVHRVLRVSRTIADLAESEDVLVEHVAEAVQYQALQGVEIPD